MIRYLNISHLIISFIDMNLLHKMYLNFINFNYLLLILNFI